ncbi:MAG: hypothetical protein L0216_19895 [Planctomycetales bacterium]|nr:hypothetical protein [Planctomycetales bacterium]
MTLLLVALAILGASGVAALAAGRRPRLATALGAGGTALACGLGLFPAAAALAGGPPEHVRAAWDMPYGSLDLELDALSAFFLLPIFLLGGLAAVYGAGYLRPHAGRRNLGLSWLFYDALVGSLVLVVLARNGVLFLLAWEAMALSSFFLVTFEDHREEVREAGWTYLVATHLGTAFLLALFLLLGREAGSLDFRDFGAHGPPAHAGALFLLAVVGFGAKAGFLPLHVWLPEAHPAAPSHVSALLSGVMIKTGIYGLARTLTWLGPPPAWWGWLLVGVGLSSGILGVLFALAQHDLKRLLAYHSVENIGIITLGLGVGVLGLASGAPLVAALGFAGGLLHVLNHALFKGLLFLGAGAVLHATGTREMDRLGGLFRRMPRTGTSFLVGAAAISGLPPLNGFASEFLIFLGALTGALSLPLAGATTCLAALAGLALIGGLAAACFTKAFGAVFLGEPRTGETAGARDPGPAMGIPMAVLAAACIVVGLLAPAGAGAIGSAVAALVPGAHGLPEHVQTGCAALSAATAVGGVFLAAAAGVALLRRAVLRGRPVASSVTWDCGYARPTARMQYTSSSFAAPLVEMFRGLLRTRLRLEATAGRFPGRASLATETPDVCREGLFAPAFRGVARLLGSLRWLQQGSVHVYVLYIAATLVALLVWRLA